MLIRFEGRNVVVAGAARGIGRAITRAFAADGATVLACDRLVGEIETGERITALAVDVTDPASIDAVVAKAGGRVDVLVYVAGGILGQRPQPIEEVAPNDFSAIVDANLKGCFLFARAVAPAMKKARAGRIVTISSRAGLATSLTGIQAYASAKHGQVGLVKQLAQELGPFGITVNSVAPGFMATSPDYERQWNSYSEEFRTNFTDRIAMRRMGRPEDIADAVLFLASERASWITGQILPVTGSPLA
ncbi:MAG: SDR family oxidoreductase [Rhodospirillaceae bacterium]|nr:SDR family oxidoreductase [Rhodospirillaceae bacterium]